MGRGSRGPVLQGGSPEGYAMPWQLLGVEPSPESLGRLPFAGGHPEVHEVELEVQRTSTTYRRLLHEALELLLLWVSQRRWHSCEWQADSTLACQVLCEHVQWLRNSG